MLSKTIIFLGRTWYYRHSAWHHCFFSKVCYCGCFCIAQVWEKVPSSADPVSTNPIQALYAPGNTLLHGNFVCVRRNNLQPIRWAEKSKKQPVMAFVDYCCFNRITETAYHSSARLVKLREYGWTTTFRCSKFYSSGSSESREFAAFLRVS